MSKKRKYIDPAEHVCTECGESPAAFSNPVREGNFIIFLPICGNCKLKHNAKKPVHRFYSQAEARAMAAELERMSVESQASAELDNK